MVFPGVTKGYLSLEKAQAFLNEPLECSEKLYKVVLKVSASGLDV